uniref:Cytochrome c oxidase subunit 3 n=5 Tax=Demodex folliculorum TaxID=481310 RepID=A0A0A7DTU9_DEMFO|nr:cytochrome c oxidase subunit III [Demodex folliculorum]AIW82496.1 cytochrome c oxidase subunit III [Demodex folliculorum]
MKKNKFHLVELSPWPIISSINTNMFFMSMIKFMKYKTNTLLIFSLSTLALSSLLWWSSVNRESSIQGLHNKKTHTLFKAGMALFITSEVLLFTSMFWNFFHLSFEASVAIYGNWPPNSLSFTNPYLLPIYGTILLISSSFMASKAHQATTTSTVNYCPINKNLLKSVMLGFLFLDMQLMEYSQSNSAMITFNQNPFSSIFFMTTGLHGSHVFVGLLFLSYTLYFSEKNYLSMKKHSSLIMAVWYWHFVDIMWLFVYYSLYFITAY